jgi:hypothetical protein
LLYREDIMHRESRMVAESNIHTTTIVTIIQVIIIFSSA